MGFAPLLEMAFVMMLGALFVTLRYLHNQRMESLANKERCYELYKTGFHE